MTENIYVYNKIRGEFEKYLLENPMLKSVVLGISGGIDSAIVAAILYDVCTVNNIKLIGRYIHIETNKEDERYRADCIGKAFCHSYKSVHLTNAYINLCDEIDEYCEEANSVESDFKRKVRLGNIKARMRMMYLYNLAQLHSGMVLDTDNNTEHNLGFWTLHGDVGDYSPIIDLWKTEVYSLSNYVVSILDNEEAKHALQICIDATPTDGLGITSSDVEQLGCNNYQEVDLILKGCDSIRFYNSLAHLKQVLEYIKKPHMDVDNSVRVSYDNYIKPILSDVSRDSIITVINRHINSEFKRNNPIHVNINY